MSAWRRWWEWETRLFPGNGTSRPGERLGLAIGVGIIVLVVALSVMSMSMR
jgi:hypothetical protein